MRLIDADELLVSIWDEKAYKDSFAYRMVACKNRFIPHHRSRPVRHGRWEWYEEWGENPRSLLAPQDPPELFDYGWRCNCCKVYLSNAVDVRCMWDDPGEEPAINYCPHCGAKMAGGKKDD